MEQEIIEGNKLKVSIKERDLVSVFMYGMKGIFPSIVTWNDLMPVVEKIEAMDALRNDVAYSDKYFVNIYGRSCEIGTKEGTLIRKYRKSHTEPKINIVWLAVVEFIKWLNQNKK